MLNTHQFVQTEQTILNRQINIYIYVRTTHNLCLALAQCNTACVVRQKNWCRGVSANPYTHRHAHGLSVYNGIHFSTCRSLSHICVASNRRLYLLQVLLRKTLK